MLYLILKKIHERMHPTMTFMALDGADASSQIAGNLFPTVEHDGCRSGCQEYSSRAR